MGQLFFPGVAAFPGSSNQLAQKAWIRFTTGATRLSKGRAVFLLCFASLLLALVREAEQAALAREKKLQETTLAIKKKFGKNAILKGMSLEEGATARERNARIGGHKA